ncbi:hypothetical protein QYF36_022457 [Acer negundo]|nr:hypothetical protein QYF36_022457 [Acer negundo]
MKVVVAASVANDARWEAIQAVRAKDGLLETTSSSNGERNTHFETDKFSCLVMEFCPGGKGNQRSIFRSRFYIAEVPLAMEYLHMLGIVYHDLKPENPSCIQPSCIVPTTCFSPRFFSSKSKKNQKSKIEMGNQVMTLLPELIAKPTNARSMSVVAFVGTHEYLAPEIIKGEGHGSAVDQ